MMIVLGMILGGTAVLALEAAAVYFILIRDRHDKLDGIEEP